MILLVTFITTILFYSDANAVIFGEETNAPQITRITVVKGSDQIYCTGTYIGPNALATAAHCIVTKKPIDQNIEVFVPLVNTIKIKDHENEKVKKIVLHLGSDLAILITDGDNQSYFKISMDRVAKNDPVLILGNGLACIDCSKQNTIIQKTVGENIIYEQKNLLDIWQELDADELYILHNYDVNVGVITIKGTTKDNPKNANILMGDSGGCLLNSEGDLIGFASSAITKINGKDVFEFKPNFVHFSGDLDFKRLINRPENNIEEGTLGFFIASRYAKSFLDFARNEGADIKFKNSNLTLNKKIQFGYYRVYYL